MNKIIFNLLILFILLFSNNPSANELLLYADNISYDSNKNIIAKGNAKIIKDREKTYGVPFKFNSDTIPVYSTDLKQLVENGYIIIEGPSIFEDTTLNNKLVSN